MRFPFLRGIPRNSVLEFGDIGDVISDSDGLTVTTTRYAREYDVNILNFSVLFVARKGMRLIWS